MGGRINRGSCDRDFKQPGIFGVWKDGLMEFYELSKWTSTTTGGWSKHTPKKTVRGYHACCETDEHPQPTTTAYATMLM